MTSKIRLICKCVIILAYVHRFSKHPLVQKIECLFEGLEESADHKESPIQWVPGAKWHGHEIDHSPTSSVKVKNAWSCTSTSLYVLMAWRLVKCRIRLHGMVLS